MTDVHNLRKEQLQNALSSSGLHVPGQATSLGQPKTRSERFDEHPMDKISRIIEGSGARIVLERLAPEHLKEFGIALSMPEMDLTQIKLAVIDKWSSKGTERFMRKYMDNPKILKAITVALGMKPAHILSSSIVEKVSEKITLLGLDTYSKNKEILSNCSGSQPTSLTAPSSSLAPPSPSKPKSRSASSTKATSENHKASPSPTPPSSPAKSRQSTPRTDTSNKPIKEQDWPYKTSRQKKKSRDDEGMDAGSSSESDPLPSSSTSGDDGLLQKKTSQSSSSELRQRREKESRE